MKMRWYSLMLHGQHDLNQAGHARGGFQCPRLALTEPNRQVLPSDRGCPIDVLPGPRLRSDHLARCRFRALRRSSIGHP